LLIRRSQSWRAGRQKRWTPSIMPSLTYLVRTLYAALLFQCLRDFQATHLLSGERNQQSSHHDHLLLQNHTPGAHRVTLGLRPRRRRANTLASACHLRCRRPGRTTPIRSRRGSACATLCGDTDCGRSPARRSGSELQVIFEHSKPTAIVFQPGGVELGRGLEVSSELPSPLLLCLDSSTPLPSLYSPTPGNDLLKCNLDGDQTTRPASSPCLILYTSGTSGKPKGFVYTEKTLLAGSPSPVCVKPMTDEADTAEKF
jgi:hypothetical protein